MAMMNNMRNTQLNLYLVVLILVAASCGFPGLSKLAVGSGDDVAVGGGSDGATSDGGPLPLGLEFLAGDIGGPGNADGTGATARFAYPTGVAVDSAGNVYVADSSNSIIRKVTAVGVVTTLAGAAGTFDSEDGTGSAAHFNFPIGMAVDGVGNIYVADGDTTIRKITATGVVTTLAGMAGVLGSADDIGSAARFNYPAGVAVDSVGNVYVADQNNHTVRKVTAAGVVTTLAGTAGIAGIADGTGAAARFDSPASLAVDIADNVYVADQNNHTIRKVTSAGVVTTLAGRAGVFGSADDAGPTACFNRPAGVAVDTAGNLYVTDQSNHVLCKVTAAGGVTTLAGTANLAGSTDGTGSGARFYGPTGVAVDSVGNIYVADRGNSIIRKVTAAGVVTTLAGTVELYDSVDDTGVAARFSIPRGVAVNSAGDFYVADQGNHTIRKVTATGVVTTLAGTAGVAGSADGMGSTARFSLPSGLAVDSAGNVYVADLMNHTIRRVTPAGDVTTLAGTANIVGSADGTGATARFDRPAGVVVDSVGNIYVADSNNSIIRKITADGDVTTLAGTAGIRGSTDGPGSAARFVSPVDVAVDNAGNIYVADQYGHTIRKISSDGVVMTLAGAAGWHGSADGPSATARFSSPSSVAVDSAGHIYVVDTDNSTIRKVTPTGATTTVAGTAGVVGILLGSTPRFSFPLGLAIVGDSIVVSDANAILLLRHGAQ